MLGNSIGNEFCEQDLICPGHKLVDVCDLNSLYSFVKSIKPKMIINASGYTNVDLAERERALCHDVNINGSRHIGFVALQEGIPCIHFSSDYVFDGEKEEEYLEDDWKNPVNYYGVCKRFSEDYFKNQLIIRSSWLYSYTGKNFVRTMLNLFKTKDVVKVVNDQFGKSTFCDDLAMYTRAIMNEKGVFHIANSGVLSWYDFAKEIYSIGTEMGLIKNQVQIVPISSSEYPLKTRRPKRAVLSTKKIEAKIGVILSPWRESLTRCLQKIQCGSF